jgi:hypothetical protein
VSANDNLGPHLLGRWPSTPDDRNFTARFLATATPLDIALQKLLASRSVAQATKDFGMEVVRVLEQQPPPPPPPPSQGPWSSYEVLDQGQTPHCVGFGGAGFLECAPVADVGITNATGDAIYGECKVIDGEPGAEDGSSVHSLATALANRKRISAYGWAASAHECADWVTAKGPVVIGSDWYNGMFTPDSKGVVSLTGGIAGGHCYFMRWYDAASNLFQFQNSWGKSWGVAGNFFMHFADLDQLLKAQGEALVAIELP